MDHSTLTQTLCSFVEERNAHNPANQFSGAVIHRGHTEVFGQADGRYPIASCTKAMTAWLAWTLSIEGRLDLDAPLAELCPGLRFKDRKTTLHLTLRDALVHRSGLPAHTWAWVYLDVDRATFFRRRLPQLDLAGPYKAAYRYSNILYGAIGLACEKATGLSWEDLLQEGLWTPLNMCDTQHLTENWHRQPRLVGSPGAAGRTGIFHAQTRHPMAPSGEVMSSARDMAAWLSYLLENNERHQALWSPDQFIRDEKEGPLHYGLGWRIETVAGQRCAWHTGGCTGYSSLCLLLPDEEVGACLLVNRHGVADELKEILFSMLRNPAPENPPCFGTKEEERVQASEPAMVAHEPGPLGCYRHPGYGGLEVDAEGVKLNGFAAGRVNQGRLYLSDYDVFFPLRQFDDALEIHFSGSPHPIRFEAPQGDEQDPR